MKYDQCPYRSECPKYNDRLFCKVLYEKCRTKHFNDEQSEHKRLHDLSEHLIKMSGRKDGN
jgi:hypothetical protein